ncbi:hypothetical protein H5410_010678 [Solanum commersonii]|uniref:Uncharacterized protein n=1 Tax=Solanum commersonii TaxID=4109 RepID=A0A9J6AM80_SOLCO|nr:hypothetical protein H5410_010678 [Solanum commersonii]
MFLPLQAVRRVHGNKQSKSKDALNCRRGGKSGRICDTRRENTIHIVVQQELEDKCAKSQLHEQTNVLSCNYDLV